MRINTGQVGIADLLSNRGTFVVPKYQRNYAWDSEQITAFLKDLDLCRKARASGGDNKRHHFFGGIVTATATVTGSTRTNNELIDGQQRLATFMMLLVQLKTAMKTLAGAAREANDSAVSTFMDGKATLILERFEEFKDTIDWEIVLIPRVRMSSADENFFAAMLRGDNPATQRRSHELLNEAFATIGDHLAKVVEDLESFGDKAKALDLVMTVLELDCTVIHMAATQRSDAHMMFQVLNDRGRSLTEGELLRASTLEAIDAVAPAQLLERVEAAWNIILTGRDLDVRKGLQWIYASHIGNWPGHSTLLGDLSDSLFPELNSEAPLTRSQADAIGSTVEAIARDFKALDDMLNGEWPVTAHGAVKPWDKDRLRLLVVHLRQHNCLPLLLAATTLEPKLFAEIVHILELFSFRYSVMIEGHPMQATSVFDRHSLDIRRNPTSYRTNALASALRALLESVAPDTVFREKLNALRYSRSETNKPLKYFLMTLEHFARWYDDGAQGRATCRDKTRILDFENSTIEHIYPENAKAPDASLEPLLDELGNVTILSPAENDAAGAKPFADKKRYFEHSQSLLNRQISTESEWTVPVLTKRQDRLVAMGLAVFRL